MRTRGNSGGGSLSPTQAVAPQLIAKSNGTMSYASYDASKKYMIFADLYGSQSVINYCALVQDGVVSEVNNALGYFTTTISGNTLTVKNTNAYYDARGMIVQLD